MSCDRIESLLSPFVDGELGRDDELGVRAHVARCAGCAGRLQTLRAVRAAVRATRPEPSADGLADLRRRLRADGRTARPRRLLWTGLAAGLALLVAGSVWVSREMREPAPAASALATPADPSDASSSPCARPAECGPDGREVWPALPI